MDAGNELKVTQWSVFTKIKGQNSDESGRQVVGEKVGSA